jgi:predicted GNAT family N-acyltransferase
VGTALVKKAEEFAREQKKDVIQLRSFESALDFYKKCGFHLEEDKFLEMSRPVEREKNSQPS